MMVPAAFFCFRGKPHAIIRGKNKKKEELWRGMQDGL